MRGIQVLQQHLIPIILKPFYVEVCSKMQKDISADSPINER